MLFIQRLSKHKQLLVICFYAGLILFVAASAAHAQSGGGTSMIENAIKVSESSEKGLDELWDITFTGTYSPAYLAVMDFAKKVMVIPFFWLFIPITRAFTFNRYEEIFKHCAWLVLVCVLTANNYGLITNITYGSRNFINDSTRGILTFQLGKVTMQDALTDVFLTQQGEDQIRAKLIECESLESTLQVRCFNEGAKSALEDIEAAEDAAKVLGIIDLSGLTRLKDRLDETIANTENELTGTAADEIIDLVAGSYGFLYQSTGQAVSQQLMKAFQNAMMTIIDVGLYLTAILAPMAVAASLAPLQPRILFVWFSGIIAFALMKMGYNILVGAIATMAVIATAGTDGLNLYGSTGLFIAMGIFSPLLAIAMGGWAGTKLVDAAGNGIQTVVAIVPIPK